MALSGNLLGRRLRTAAAHVLVATCATAFPFIAAHAGDGRQTVVELFTSQGCSSCPPADDLLAKLSQRPGLIALSFGVTYWDRLGWRDTNARKDFTARQIAYEAPLGESGPFTPQIVVGGRASATGSEVATVERLIAAERETAPAATVSLQPNAIVVGQGQAPRGGADIWLVRYDPRRIEVPVKQGENAGRTLAHANVVRDLAMVGQWMGTTVTIALPAAAPGLRTAVIVQARNHGPIVAAGTD